MAGGAQAAVDAARKGPPKPEKPLSEAAVSLPDFMGTEFPERKWLIGDWLPEEGLALLVAHRGTGKSWIAMSAGLALARGEKFVVWDVPSPERVLYVQVEMPQRQDQDRFGLLLGETPPPENFTYLSYQKMIGLDMPALKLDKPGPQAAFLKFLEEQKADPYKLIILDAYSAVTSVGFNPDKAEDARPVVQFLIELRLRGYTVLLLHHTGHDQTRQRGASLLEDQMDTSVLLRRDPAYKGREAEFKVTFPKARDLAPAESNLILTLCPQPDGTLGWATRAAEKQTFEPLLRAVRDGEATRAVQLEAILDKPRSTVSTLVRRAKRDKLLVNQTGELLLTDKGRALVPTGRGPDQRRRG